MESESLTYLREAELKLQREQSQTSNRDRAIALTHIQTAILWLCKDELEQNLAVARRAARSQNQ